MKSKLLLAGIGLISGWLWNQQQKQKPKSIKNAVTIITGGASGIGEATAHAFARHGAIVIIADLDHQLTDTLKQSFKPYETEVLFIVCDITRHEKRQQLIDEVMQHYGRVDILINNAGLSKGGEFTDLSSDDIDKLITVNLLGTLHLTHAVLAIMKTQKQGHIVNISSINGVMPPPGEALYSATKAGLNAFSDSLRRELGETNINVSVVMPALTQTAMLNQVTEDELRQNQLLMAWMRLDTAKQVADQILNAVQFNIREIVCGGQSMEVLAKVAPLRPSAMDWVFKHLINTDKFIATLKKLGGTELSEDS